MMKVGLVCLFAILNSLLFSQEYFAITEQGITPKSILLNLENKDLYGKAMSWITSNAETHTLEILDTMEESTIKFTSTKGNAVILDKQYYNVKHIIKLNFTPKGVEFTPIGVELKLNSKYDMGWKPIDIDNCSQYFKKGKPIRKYREYLTSIVTPLNSIHSLITTDLKDN